MSLSVFTVFRDVPDSSYFKFLIVFLLKCRFSMFKKYLVFFSPSLYQRVLDLIIEPFVLYSISFQDLVYNFLTPSSSWLDFPHYCNFPIAFEDFEFQILISFPDSPHELFFCFAYKIELALISIFKTSQNNMLSISLSFSY